MVWKRPARPTGIVRCLPYFGAQTASDEAMKLALLLVVGYFLGLLTRYLIGLALERWGR